MIQNIYKPKGKTSFTVVGDVKRKYNVKKAGHAGTLDPLAAGVLVVLTGNDTKKQDEIMKQDKEYIAQVTFGIKTDSFDMEFVPTLLTQPKLTEIEAKLPRMLEKYTGEFEQTIPNYSAKKIAGKPMYDLARNNPEALKDIVHTKHVLVKELKVLSFGEHTIKTNEGEKVLPYVELKIACTHGFYVRALANDLGNEFGFGAVLTDLVRTKVGNFSIENAIKLDE